MKSKATFQLLTLTPAALAVIAAVTVLTAQDKQDAAPAAKAEPKTVLFNNVRVLDSAKGTLTGAMNVLVKGNTIAKISAEGIPVDRSGLTLVINGEGRTLMPGLIDNHTHMFMTASSQMDMLRPGATAETIATAALVEAERMLLRGFTAVRDLGGPSFEMKKAIDAGKAKGPRIYPSGAMISQTSGHGDTRLPNEKSRRFFGQPSKGELTGVNFIADGVDEVLTATRENLRFGATQIKVMAGGGAATAYDPLDVAQYTFAELKAAVDAADDWNTYVTVHAYTPKAVRRAVEAGVKCIEHGQLLDEPTLQLLGEKGVWLSLQILDEAPATAPEFIRQKKHQVVEGTSNAFQWAKKHKVKLAWGTDMMFDPTQMKNQNPNIVRLKQWFTPGEALKILTRDNAELLALSGPRNAYPGKLGVVEEGALADLLLVDGDPTTDLEVVADPEKNFRVIMKDGKIFKNTVD